MFSYQSHFSPACLALADGIIAFVMQQRHGMYLCGWSLALSLLLLVWKAPALLAYLSNEDERHVEQRKILICWTRSWKCGTSFHLCSKCSHWKIHLLSDPIHWCSWRSWGHPAARGKLVNLRGGTLRRIIAAISKMSSNGQFILFSFLHTHTHKH